MVQAVICQVTEKKKKKKKVMNQKQSKSPSNRTQRRLQELVLILLSRQLVLDTFHSVQRRGQINAIILMYEKNQLISHMTEMFAPSEPARFRAALLMWYFKKCQYGNTAGGGSSRCSHLHLYFVPTWTLTLEHVHRPCRSVISTHTMHDGVHRCPCGLDLGLWLWTAQCRKDTADV